MELTVANVRAMRHHSFRKAETKSFLAVICLSPNALLQLA
jgi:hypothetical protein